MLTYFEPTAKDPVQYWEFSSGFDSLRTRDCDCQAIFALARDILHQWQIGDTTKYVEEEVFTFGG